MKQPISIEIVTKDDIHAVINKNSGVAVLLYTTDESDLLDKIGVVTEKNPHFDSGTYTGIIMGTVEKDDSSLLIRAKQEATEESGYTIPENDKWHFLGEIHTSKLFTGSIYCYAANITGLTPEKPSGDGSKSEKDIQFKLIDINQIQKIPDSVLQACFLKLFTKLYKYKINS